MIVNVQQMWNISILEMESAEFEISGATDSTFILG